MVLAVDIGGVLVHDPLHELLDALEGSGGIPQRKMQEAYINELRYPLWSGTMEEEEFWREVLRISGASGSPEDWREFLLASLRPLPAAERLSELADRAPLYSLSNHRAEWIRPVLEDNNFDQYFRSILLSSEHGQVKPEEEFFEILLAKSGARPEEVLFVDNLPRNLLVAEEMGMAVLQADPGGDWVDLVENRL